MFLDGTVHSIFSLMSSVASMGPQPVTYFGNISYIHMLQGAIKQKFYKMWKELKREGEGGEVSARIKIVSGFSKFS